MAISERTFVDRYQRATTLSSAISSFDPVFAPANNEKILPPAFATFVEEVDAANSAVTGASDDYTAQVEERNELLAGAKDRCSRVISLLQAVPAWSHELTAIKRHYDKLRGYRPARVKPPVGDTGETGVKAQKRNQGEQGHAETAKHIANIASGLEKINNYTTPVDDISAAAIRELADDYAELNGAMGSLALDVTVAREKRHAIYEGPDGLRERMKAIKSAIRAQYGTKSAEYVAVKGIRL